MTNDKRREAVVKEIKRRPGFLSMGFDDMIREGYDAGAAHERARWDGQPVIDRANAAEQALAEVRAWADEQCALGNDIDADDWRALDAILAKTEGGRK